MITSFHHVGCLVKSIEESVAHYSVLYPDGDVSEIYDIADQKVKVCFFNMAGTYIEFVEPGSENATLLRLLAKTGSGYYHIGIFTDNIDLEINRLEKEGYIKMNKFRSKAFNDQYCSFLYSPDMHLIELIERK